MWYEPNEWGRVQEPVTEVRVGDGRPGAGEAVIGRTAIPILLDLATYAPEAMTWAELDVVIAARADTYRGAITESAELASAELVAVFAAATPAAIAELATAGEAA
jgi:hypothetical protein